MLFKLKKIEATKWVKNGDHPKDGRSGEGKVVRYFRHPDFDSETKCPKCGIRYHNHGWLDQYPDQGPVCPGTYIVTVGDEYQPLEPKIFEALFKPCN